MVKNIDEVFVATCDREIFEYVESIGGKCIMTSDKHTRASTRAAEALQKIEKEYRMMIPLVVMVQGDEPAISPNVISNIVHAFDDEDVQIANIMSLIRSEEDFNDKNNVKVVVDRNNDALYFSREPIPSSWVEDQHAPRFMQTGIIAFRRDALIEFNSMDETTLEKVESIDMNRVLESGRSVRMVNTE
jgi:CMP-2-keto-3-deoxyoctulosonic acid synthetase